MRHPVTLLPRASLRVRMGSHDAHYGGEFGKGLAKLGRTQGHDWFTQADLKRPQAEWVEPLRASAWGVDLWTVPPNSQGYLTLASAALAAQFDLPDDPNDERWAHLLIEASKVAADHRFSGRTDAGQIGKGSRDRP